MKPERFQEPERQKYKSTHLQMLTGKHIRLRPATTDDRRAIYEWLSQADTTHLMMGPPDFPENEIPTYQEFLADYNENYFRNENPLKGRSYIILAHDEAVGHINYNDIEDATTELDIWLAGSAQTGKGYGTDAINTLCDYLSKELGCTEFILAPAAKNERAVRAYQKCGFRITDKIPSWFVPDYKETVVLHKVI